MQKRPEAVTQIDTSPDHRSLTFPLTQRSLSAMSSWRIGGADLETLLDDVIRYDRSGVSARARAFFVEITERARERPDIAAEAWWGLANGARLQTQWGDAVHK